jgi:hypothetical protein
MRAFTPGKYESGRRRASAAIHSWPRCAPVFLASIALRWCCSSFARSSANRGGYNFYLFAWASSLGPVSGARTSDLHSLLAAPPSARVQIPWGCPLAAANESDVRSSLGSQGALLAAFRAAGGRGGLWRKSRVRKSRGPGPGSSLTEIESPFRSSSLSVAQTSTSSFRGPVSGARTSDLHSLLAGETFEDLVRNRNISFKTHTNRGGYNLKFFFLNMLMKAAEAAIISEEATADLPSRANTKVALL